MAFKKINDVSCKNTTIATLVDFSDIDPITRCEFKTSALNGSEYFTSLKMTIKIKSQMTHKTTIPGGNIASKLFDELSHSGFNVGESKNSADSSISTKVDSLMVDATDMDERFAMMEQTIEALKKSIDDKNLQIAQLMSMLDLYNSGESHHNLTTQEKVDIDSPTKSVDSQSAKRSTLLLTKKVIALPESKRPKESNKVDDPMYCKFDRIIGHHTTKCFILKENIMTLVREGKIIIDNGETAETNHASVKLDHKNDSISEVLCLVASPKLEEDVIILQFGRFEPVEIFALKKTTNTSKVDEFSNEESGDTWTLVALKRQKHQGTSKLRLSKVDTKSSTN
ncbi:hypothetical protein R3W88_016872 [Solanum pinnatisectum]|uniref:Uncharacterized protein n=1 Tax=Solanum pinnatisectum TaxID=50273 RepID=A0AAV9L120_9SOLN|nr:hypothetical protein R3W88_016872 [Solanum pinnatisectum]